MFYRKNERKRCSYCVILTVGALAAVGAVTVAKCGKRMMKDASCKIKGFFEKNTCRCPVEEE